MTDWIDLEIGILCGRRAVAWGMVLEACASPYPTTDFLRAAIAQWDRLDIQIQVMQEYIGGIRCGRALGMHPLWGTAPMGDDAHKGSRHEWRVAA